MSKISNTKSDRAAAEKRFFSRDLHNSQASEVSKIGKEETERCTHSSRVIPESTPGVRDVTG